MLKIFYGTDRIGIEKEVKRELGAEYEVYDGEKMNRNELKDILTGISLFEQERRILVKDLSKNAEVWGKIEEILNGVEIKHKIVIWEEKLDKRTVVYKGLQKMGVVIKEVKLPEKSKSERNEVFDVLRVAMRDGKRAVKMVEKMELERSANEFLGVLVKQVTDNYAKKQGEKEKRVLKTLSDLDIKMKTTATEPWLLVKIFLLQVSRL